MKPLSYAIAALLLVLTIPDVTADDGCDTVICLGEPGSTLPPYPHCAVFIYGINPFGYTFHPECLFPLPP